MDGFSRCIFPLLIIASAIGLIHGVVQVKVTASAEHAYVGDSINATCVVTVPTDTYVDIVTWVLKTPDNKEIDLATNLLGKNENIKVKFNYTNSYPMIITSKLEINDLLTSYSGELGCEVPYGQQQKVIAYSKLIVYEPIKKVTMESQTVSGGGKKIYKDGDIVTFKEDDQLQFYCIAEGGYPEPELRIRLDNQDISKLFDKNINIVEKKIGNDKMLYYNSTLINPELTMSYNYSNKLLVCEAHIKDPQKKFKKVAKSIEIKIDGFTPKFLCGNHQLTRLHQSRLKINCTVRADKAAHNFSVSWFTNMGDSLTLLDGGSVTDYKFNVHQKNNSLLEHVVVLEIDRVFGNHLITYNFSAQNDLGSTVHPIHLQLDDTEMQTPEPHAIKNAGQAIGGGSQTTPIAYLLLSINTFLLAALL